MDTQTQPPIDHAAVAGLGEGWAAFNQSGREQAGHRDVFEQNLVFPCNALPPRPNGFDLACAVSVDAFPSILHRKRDFNRVARGRKPG